MGCCSKLRQIPIHKSHTLPHCRISQNASPSHFHKIPGFLCDTPNTTNTQLRFIDPAMCIQYKRGWTHCPHVESDLYIIACSSQYLGEPCIFTITSNPVWAWVGTRVDGKCLFCNMEDFDAREKKRRRKRPLSKVDLDEIRGNTKGTKQSWHDLSTYDT
jgi:hypothetical protein